jgi:hypothetical protein
MSSSVLRVFVSFDGSVAGPNAEPGNAGGDDVMRLASAATRPHKT